MAKTKTLPLRILYTINNSPQYILARSHTVVPVVLVPPEATTALNLDVTVPISSVYATVSLTYCLNTICRSSPELVQDKNRDFSVYVLDPLESNSAPAPVHITNARNGVSTSHATGASQTQPRGVAVGLGLMSWALTAEESDGVSVTGTLFKQGTGHEALEVIFALRETAAMQKASLPGAVQSWCNPLTLSSVSGSHFGSATSVDPKPTTLLNISSSPASISSTVTTLSTLASIHLRNKSRIKPKKIPKPSNTPVTESDRLLDSSNIYIGPLKKKGRPRTAIPSQKSHLERAPASGSHVKRQEEEVFVTDGSESSDGAVPCQSDANGNQFLKTKIANDHNISLGGRSSDHTGSTSNHIKAEPKEERNLLDVFALLSDPRNLNGLPAQDVAILQTLNTIDSTNDQKSPSGDTGPNPALISALQHLLSVYASQSSKEQIDNRPVSGPTTGQDDDVVLIDKENVDPHTFHGRSAKTDQDDRQIRSYNSSATEAFRSSGNSKQVPRAEKSSQSFGFGGRSSENTPEKFASVGNATVRPQATQRKRTLSDIMDERDSEKDRERSRHRDKGRKDSLRRTHTQNRQIPALAPEPPALDGLRHYPRLLSTQPPCPTQTPNYSYYRTGSEPWTSPPRRSKAEGPQSRPEYQRQNQHRPLSPSRSGPESVKFPRISLSSPVKPNSSQIRPRKKYIVPEWARTNTATQPRLSEKARRALEEAEENKKKEKASRRKAAASAQMKHQEKTVTPGGQHTTVRKSAPANDIPPCVYKGPIAASNDCSVFSECASPPRSPSTSPFKLPMAIPKTPVRKRPTSRPTPGSVQGSLFTPRPGSHSIGSSKSPSFSPLHGIEAPQSPLSSRAKSAMSPIQSVVSGKGVMERPGWGLPINASSSNAQVPVNDDLAREMNEAFQELGCPLVSSSSCVDGDENDAATKAISHAESDTEENDVDEGLQVRKKQPWAGLPPSSPPPPSSPDLKPEDGGDILTDEDVSELDLPTLPSDASLDTPNLNTASSSPANDYLGCSEEEMMAYADDLSSIFLPAPGAAKDMVVGSMDVFDQFTNVNAQYDDVQLSGSMDPTFQADLEGIDFSEFWATFKPLLDDGAAQEGMPNMDFGFGSNVGHLVEAQPKYDHVKLAADVQALFSGCLM